jgi:hypothetical protein
MGSEKWEATRRRLTQMAVFGYILVRFIAGTVAETQASSLLSTSLHSYVYETNFASVVVPAHRGPVGGVQLVCGRGCIRRTVFGVAQSLGANGFADHRGLGTRAMRVCFAGRFFALRPILGFSAGRLTERRGLRQRRANPSENPAGLPRLIPRK